MTDKRKRSLQTIVGQEAYTVWTDMLRSLVPDGRTHRLAMVVAGMLQYASIVAYEKYGDNPKEGSVGHSLLLASEGNADHLLDVVEQLFEDADVEYERVNRRGDTYSIAYSAIHEFVHWHSMPWES